MLSLAPVQDSRPPTFMAPEAAGEAIRSRVQPGGPLTVADISARTGLPLRDAESGLKWLSAEYRGQLRVTADGDLVHVFPTGFTRPWEAQDARKRLVRAVGRGLSTVLHFAVRVWVLVVLVGYAAVFLAVLIGLMFARQGGDDSRRRDDDGLPGGALAYGLLRVLGDALFWTFHPWSPFSVYATAGMGGGPRYAPRRSPREPRVPLYERVNHFFFGPSTPPDDPREDERRVVEAIRAGKGRIGLADVMRITGLPRDRADPMMARLMLDYDGDVTVSEEGGIAYRFPALRKTASDGVRPASAAPPAAWTRVRPLPPVTGNPPGADVLIALVNGFNLFMGLFALDAGLTLARFSHLFDRVPQPFVDTGLPVALGVVPVAFSVLLFAVPLSRLLARPWRARRASEEGGRLAILREVLAHVAAKKPMTDDDAAEAWRSATGRPPEAKRLDRQLVALGGNVDISEDGRTRWRFADLETEAAAVAAERDAAPDEEARLGQVVFASDERS